MEVENFLSSSYTGSKNFSQQDVHTANASGFGAAADDYMERGIDLNEQLIRNKPATFFMKMNGSSMINAPFHIIICCCAKAGGIRCVYILLTKIFAASIAAA